MIYTNNSIKRFPTSSDFDFRTYFEELADDIEEIQHLESIEERELKTEIIDSKFQYLFQKINEGNILENRILKFLAAVKRGWQGRGQYFGRRF